MWRSGAWMNQFGRREEFSRVFLGVLEIILFHSLDMAALVAQASSCNRSLTFPTAPTQGGVCFIVVNC